MSKSAHVGPARGIRREGAFGARITYEELTA